MAAVLAQSQAATAATPETTSAATASQQNGTSVQAQPPSIAADLATETVDSAKDGSDPIRADEPQSTSAIPAPSQGLPALQALTLTDTILGYGSHGTVVYKGLFENREVAIKRLLVDFYEVADHEVRLLQESDHHPNVVRYYYKEQCEGFMYIALELCPASLFDLVEKSAVREVQDLRRLLKPKHILQEIMMGIQHLHSMKIVHRDIKPQNILIGGPKSRKDMTPRILISDFGLGKRLADDQSSFHNTVGFAGGTAGWRAPECLFALSAFGTGLGSSSGDQDSDSAASPGSPAQEWMTPGGPRGRSALLAAAGVPPSTDSLMRMSRAIDMFACGCLFYYVLTNGGHPFGDKFAREVNVLRNNYRLDGLDALKEEGVLAKDLIKRMISKDPKKRPDATAVLQHPFFWSATHRLAFLQDVSDRLEIEPRDPPSPLVKLVERGAAKVTGSDWCRKVDRSLIDNLGKYRKYDGASVLDLLRALRNKKHHYQDLPAPVKKTLGALPDAFLSYFESRFPLLLLHCYACVADSKVLRSDPLLTAYFGTPAS
ncbi:kinase-like domain-containing protein [Entophlyctis helioformis]|nr:kinase-like domain-containing protein [Entophlyctis helioformis]